MTMLPMLIIGALAGRTAMRMFSPGGASSGSIYGTTSTPSPTPSGVSQKGKTYAEKGLTGTHRTGGVAGVAPIPVRRVVTAGPSGAGTVTTEAPPAPISTGGRKRRDTGRTHRY